MEAVVGWFAEPIYGSGDYPESLKASHRGVIPEFSAQERLWIKGTADFFSLAFGPETLRVGQGLAQVWADGEAGPEGSSGLGPADVWRSTGSGGREQLVL